MSAKFSAPLLSYLFQFYYLHKRYIIPRFKYYFNYNEFGIIKPIEFDGFKTH